MVGMGPITEQVRRLYGFPDGVDEDAVMRVEVDNSGAAKPRVTIESVRRLPPRYAGSRRVADFTPAGCCADDERVISYSWGPCATIALPRLEHTTWVNDGSGWRNAGSRVTA